MADIGTVVHTEQTHSSVKKIKFSWTTSAVGGDAGKAQHTTDAAFDGAIQMVTTIPGIVGDQPSDNYTIRLLDDDGVDLLAGQGVTNRDQTNTEMISTGMAGLATSKLTLQIEAAGNTKKGTVYCYIR
jgi:hypothetical protein